MRKITHNEVMREIWNNSSEFFISEMAVHKWNSVKYTFARFKDNMMRNELIVDERTMKLKWDLLQAKGIIKEVGKSGYKDSILNIWAFSNIMGDSARKLLQDTGTEAIGYGINPLSLRETHTETEAF